MRYNSTRRSQPSFYKPNAGRSDRLVKIGRSPQLGVLLASVSALVLAGIGYATMRQSNDQVAACEAGEARAVHVIVLDYTDHLEGRQVQAAQELLERLAVQSFSGGDAVTIAAVTGSADAPIRTVLQACVPKRGRQAFPLFETAKKVEARYEATFLPDYRMALREAISPEYPQTPFFQAVERAYLQAEQRYGASDIQLHIVSDGLHNLNDVTAYGDASSPRFLFRPEVVARLEAGAHPMPHGDIHIHLIERFSHLDRNGQDMSRRQQQLYALLEAYYRNSSARTVSVKPL